MQVKVMERLLGDEYQRARKEDGRVAVGCGGFGPPLVGTGMTGAWWMYIGASCRRKYALLYLLYSFRTFVISQQFLNHQEMQWIHRRTDNFTPAASDPKLHLRFHGSTVPPLGFLRQDWDEECGDRRQEIVFIGQKLVEATWRKLGFWVLAISCQKKSGTII